MQGVLVGLNCEQEWLLAWFYTHFRNFNPELPIAFADFGMSKEAREWCLERGDVFDVPELAGPKPANFLFQGDQWKEWKLDTFTWTADRWLCFRKPLAIALSPFEKTLWLDLDCQIRASLEPLFSLPLSSTKFGATPCGSYFYAHNLSKDLVYLIDKYHTGVVLTEKSSPLLHQWTDSITSDPSFRTEEGPLSFLAAKNNLPITEISRLYNWSVFTWGENNDAAIYHWLGKEAKEYLRRLIINT